MSSAADQAEAVDQQAELLAGLQHHLGDAVVRSEIVGGDLWVRVERAAWRTVAEVGKAHLGLDYFCFLAGIDWMLNPDLSGEKVWDPDGGASIEGADDEPSGAPGAGVTGVTGGDTRFQVFARLYSISRKAGVTLKADLDDANPSVDSWTGVYRGADWHEREAWEMYGFNFDGHPGLRHMYLPGEFEGHPLRKDFPLLSREVKPWPGLVDVEPMPGEEAAPPEGGEGAEG